MLHRHLRRGLWDPGGGIGVQEIVVKEMRILSRAQAIAMQFSLKKETVMSAISVLAVRE